MKALIHQKKSLVLISVKQTQTFAWVYIIMLIKSYLFVNGKESLNLKLTIKMLTFQLNFVFEVYLMDLVLLSVEKYL